MQYEKLRRGRERKEIVIEARLLKPSELKKMGSELWRVAYCLALCAQRRRSVCRLSKSLAV